MLDITPLIAFFLPFTVCYLFLSFLYSHMSIWVLQLFLYSLLCLCFALFIRCIISFVVCYLFLRKDELHENHKDFHLCPLTLTAFSKTRAPRGRSPLGPSIQTDLLCWGVISTGWPSPPLLPGFLGPPNGRRLMSTRNFVPHFLQPPPDPPCSWKTLAPAQRAPVRP